MEGMKRKKKEMKNKKKKREIKKRKEKEFVKNLTKTDVPSLPIGIKNKNS